MSNPPVMKRLAVFLSWLPFVSAVQAEQLQIGQKAPDFTLQAHDSSLFSLTSRQGRGWTVLYFYPKADTPGCTKQACAFRDAIEVIRKQNAEVYGISTDTVRQLQAFHQKYKLTFPLLSDADAAVTEAYGVKMPMLNMAKRWTFLIDPDLQVRHIDDDVDPAMDAQLVAKRLEKLQSGQ